MDVLIDRCGGLDVHEDTVMACVRCPGDDGNRVQHVAEFRTFTGDLRALGDWLADHAVTEVAMEATGVYWKPVVRHEALMNRGEMRGLLLGAVAAVR